MEWDKNGNFFVTQRERFLFYLTMCHKLTIAPQKMFMAVKLPRTYLHT